MVESNKMILKIFVFHPNMFFPYYLRVERPDVGIIHKKFKKKVIKKKLKKRKNIRQGGNAQPNKQHPQSTITSA